MKDTSNTDVQRTMRQIEDRRIESLLKIGDINKEYDERMSRLTSEYDRSSTEYYELRLGRAMNRERV